MSLNSRRARGLRQAARPIPLGLDDDFKPTPFKWWEEGLPARVIDRLAAKYQKKKEVPKAKGNGTTTVYEYSEKQVQHRNREKAKQVEKLRKSIGDLRKRYKADLTAEDEKTRYTALAIALMDHTFERVGNDESAKDGHFGVTGWQAKHVKITEGKATISYVGKSGVKHKKEVTDKATVAAIKSALEGKSGDDQLCAGEECRIDASDVNEYLDEFGVTAKDVRGFHANSEVQRRLKEVRNQGGKLPEDKKEREKKLKDEFTKALEEAAKAVGHESSTLRSQYLVPGLEEAFLADGSVKDKLDKQARVKTANRTSVFLAGFFDRHPKLKGYQNIKVADSDGSGHGGHGEARFDSRKILIFPKFWKLPQGTRDFVFAHEIGHWLVSQEGLSGILKALQAQGIDPWDSFNLPFGQFNMEEAFCDCFASYHTDKDVFRRYPEWVPVVEHVQARQKTASALTFEIGPQPGLGFSVKARDGGVLVGSVWVNEPKVSHCESDVSALSDLVGKPLKSLYVAWSQLNDGYKGQGQGVLMYEHALKEASKRGAALLAGDCDGHSVSPDALRVWDALRRRGYLVVGRAAYSRGGRMATKSEGEKETDEVERLQRKNPTKKPPRQDLRRNRMKPEDKDLEGSGADGDKDLSLNYKKVGRLTGRYLRHILSAQTPRKPGDVWQADSGKWVAMNPKGNTHTFGTDQDAKDQATAFAKGLAEKGEDTAEAVKKQKNKERREKLRAEREEFRAEAKSIVEGLDLSDEVRDALEKQIQVSGRNEILRAFQEEKKRMDERLSAGITADMMRNAGSDPFKDVDLGDSDQVAEALVQAMVRDRLLLNPLAVGGKPLSETPLSDDQLAERAQEAMRQFKHVSAELRDAAARRAVKALEGMDADSPQARELNKIIDGLHAAAVVKLEDFPTEIREPLNEKLAHVVREMVAQGTAQVLFLPDQSQLYEREGRLAVRSALEGLDDATLREVTAGSPWSRLAEILDNPDIDDEVKDYLRSLSIDFTVNSMTTIQGVAASIVQARPVQGDAKTTSGVYKQVAKEIQEASAEHMVKILSKCLEADDMVACFESHRGALVQAQMRGVLDYLDGLDRDAKPDPQDVVTALTTAVAQGGDPKMLDDEWQVEKPVATRKQEYLDTLEDPDEKLRVQQMTLDEFKELERQALN